MAVSKSQRQTEPKSLLNSSEIACQRILLSSTASISFVRKLFRQVASEVRGGTSLTATLWRYICTCDLYEQPSQTANLLLALRLVPRLSTICCSYCIAVRSL